jgi:hypothetical protein
MDIFFVWTVESRIGFNDVHILDNGLRITMEACSGGGEVLFRISAFRSSIGVSFPRCKWLAR